MPTSEMTYYKSLLDYIEHIKLLELEGIKLTVAVLAKGVASGRSEGRCEGRGEGRGDRGVVVTVGAGMEKNTFLRGTFFVKYIIVGI
jgi:hypothetical protein